MSSDMIDVSRKDWDGFLDAFSRQHQGRIVTIGTQMPGTGFKRDFDKTPLEGITVNLKSNEPVITIIVRNEEGGHALHTVSTPQRLRVEHDTQGLAKTLHIEGAEGATTIMRLDRTEVPEAVQRAT